MARPASTPPESGPRLPPAARRAQLVEILRRHGSATTGRLADAMQVSVVTIHRDLELLEQQGALVREQGGASLPSHRPARAHFAIDWSARIEARAGAKAAIARRALDLIEPASTIFLDGSTTALALAVALDENPVPVTVVTDSPAAAVAIQTPEVQVVMAPGHVDHELRMLSGMWTTEFLAQLNYTSAFVSGAAVDLRSGVTTTRREILDIVTTVMGRAESTYCLADSSKFGRTALLGIADVAAFTAVLTDDQLDERVAQQYLDAGVRLVRCAL